VYPLKTIVIGCDEETLPHVRRELMNAEAFLEGEFSQVGDAIAALRAVGPEKRLLIFHVRSAEELRGLSRLSDCCAGSPILALMDLQGEARPVLSSTFLSAMRAGATQIVPLPLTPSDFKAALDRISTQFITTNKDARTIAIAGATGGCGATTLAVNLAYEIAHRRNLRCILVDLSLKMGQVATYLNVEPRHTISDLLRDPGRVDSLLLQASLVRVAQNFQILAGPQRLASPVAASPQAVAKILGTAGQIADVVLIDLHCTYDDVFFETLADSQTMVLVGEQKIPSVRSLKQVQEAVGRAGAGRDEHIVINRYDPKIPGFGVDRLLKVLDVPSLQTVAEDRAAVSACLNRGCTLRQESPRSRILADIDALADVLLPSDHRPKAEPRPSGLFGRLRRAITNH
jgi:pilus assembly protein CpaE